MFSLLNDASLLRFYHGVYASPSHYFSNFGILFPPQIVSIKSLRCEFISEKTLFNSHSLFRAKRYFLLASSRSPNGLHLLRIEQPIRSPENTWTTVVCIRHWTSWSKTMDIPPKCGIRLNIAHGYIQNGNTNTTKQRTAYAPVYDVVEIYFT